MTGFGRVQTWKREPLIDATITFSVTSTPSSEEMKERGYLSPNTVNYQPQEPSHSLTQYKTDFLFPEWLYRGARGEWENLPKDSSIV